MKKRIFSLFLAALMLVGAVLATGAFAAGESTGYPDVPATRWSAEDIAYMTEQGIMTDTGSGKFEPTKSVNRAMVVTVLYRMAGNPTVNGKSTFSDVESGKWYTEAVIWGTNNSIVTGFSDSTFRPLDGVTREQLVTFIGRYADLNYIEVTGDELTGFTDTAKIHSYALEYFRWAVATELVKGVTATTVQPAAGATREQFAAIMHRFATSDKFEYQVVYNQPQLISQYTEKEYPLVTDADFYVAVDGDDSNPGTLAAPFATFERAKEAVRELKATKTGEIVVAFKAGNYGYLDNITFTAEDAGTEETPITYCAYGDGDVIFDNGVTVLNEEFEPIDESDYYLFTERNYDSIYKAYIGDKLDKVGQYTILFSGSEICWEARYPNKYNDVDAYITDMTTRVDQFSSIMLQMVAKKVVDSFRTTEGMKVTGLLRFGWLTDTFLVESYDPETGILVFDFDNPDFYPWGDYPMLPWDLENKTGYEYDQTRVDLYGEAGWAVLAFEDRFDDTLFFHNLSDQLDQSGEYWVDTDTMTLYVYDPDGDYTFSDGGTFITVETGADHISFVGFEFNGSSDVAVYCRADYATFDLCAFRNISGDYALQASGVHDFTVSNCEFEKFGAGGLDIYAEADLINLVPSNNVVYNNYFLNFGFLDYWRNGINISNDVKAVISHNVFENGAHGGIRYNTCVMLDIEYNVFDGLMASTVDLGCVYTCDSGIYRGTNIRYNLFMNIDSGQKYAIYLDEQTHGQNVYGNLFYKAGGGTVVMNGGRDNEFHDNIILGMSTSAIITNLKLYDYYKNGTVDTFVPGESNYNFLLKDIPTEGHPAYEKWLELWPILYSYTTDISKISEPECVFSNTNYFRNNAIIGGTFGEYDPTDLFWVCAVFENNVDYDAAENPFFVNPALGDYRMRDDADFEYIPFEMMGRE